MNSAATEGFCPEAETEDQGPSLSNATQHRPEPASERKSRAPLDQMFVKRSMPSVGRGAEAGM